MRYLIPALMALFLALPVMGQGGQSYVYVTDCSSGQPIVGATVTVQLSDTVSVSTVTNATGYAAFSIPSGTYGYVVDMMGYRVRYGEGRFQPGSVVATCLFRATEGFWRVVAEILEWRGDIHAGGRGWAMLRLKNLEDGVFNITRLEIWVGGYGRPISVKEMPGGAVVGRVEGVFNMTVSPPQDSPVGRVKAELRFKAVFTYPDGRSIGPLTVYTDLDYVLIQPYRTMAVKLLDFWGLNTVPNTTLVLVDQLTKAQHTFRGNSTGYAAFERLPEGVYRVSVLYDSPYDGETHTISERYYILADLASTATIRNNIYEAHVRTRDLSGRALNATVYLGRVGVEAGPVEAPAGVEALAVFKNVPKGVYPVRAFWQGVEVFEGSVEVDEPFAKPSPGGYLDATVDVGDITVVPRDSQGRRLPAEAIATLQPGNISVSTLTEASFQHLPRGEYRVVVSAYNGLLHSYVVVGSYSFSIPEDHGRHELRLGVFDARIKLLTDDGRPAPVEKLSVEGVEYSLEGGELVIYNITAGQYRMGASYMGIPVLDEAVTLSGEYTEVVTGIHRLTVRASTVDGEPLEKALLSVDVAGRALEAEVADGLATIDFIPGGTYTAVLRLGGDEVFRGEIRVGGGEVSVTANAGRAVVYLLDQKGVPIPAGEVEVVGVGRAVTGQDGSARLPQAPIRDYPFRVFYSGLEAASGMLRPGEPVKVSVRLVDIVVKVVNEFGSPLDSGIDLSRGGRLAGSSVGSEARFERVPAGAYTLRVTYGPRQVEQTVRAENDVNEVAVTMPVAVALPGITLSMSELYTVVTPLIAVGVAVSSLIAFSKLRRRVGFRLRLREEEYPAERRRRRVVGAR